MVPKGRTLFGRDPRVVLDAAIADINAHQGDAELLVLTGDLTHRGAPEAFEHLAEALAPLTVPIRLLIGNHDDREADRVVVHFHDFLDRSERFFLDASPWNDDSRGPG